ncbi:MAG: MotA/TolQ/ExbB proton channel family protein, partial [Syntrophales bacterium]|nr:MotA/TolQ/ExbB proton channel family protein [Syntrophales bacterium]
MVDLFIKGGALMWPIALCSVMLVAIMIHKTVQFKVLLRQLSWPRERLLDKRPAHIAPLLDALVGNQGGEVIALAGSRNLKALEKG